MIVFHVFNSVEWVGEFHCRTFSTKDLAETFIINNLDSFPNLYILEEQLDDMELLS